MHCSIWRWEGDPDELERRYVALMSGVQESNHLLHAAARTRDGIVVVDTCRSREAFESFYGSEQVRSLFEQHGLPLGRCEDYPVIRAFAAGARIDDA